MDDRDTDTTEGEEKPLICEGYDNYYYFLLRIILLVLTWTNKLD